MDSNSLIKFLQQQILSCLFPCYCFICKEKTTPPIDLCDACSKHITNETNRCQCCARTIPKPALLCGQCISRPPHFDKVICLGNYNGLLKDLIIQFKFQHQLFLSKLLGLLLCQQLVGINKPELLIAVPLPRKRLAQRGFNQALELTRIISKQLSIPLDRNLCQRLRFTPPQTSLPAKQRAANVRNAFKLTAVTRNKHIAIIDDVVTTGSTVNEISRILKQQGVEYIEIWCIARA